MRFDTSLLDLNILNDLMNVKNKWNEAVLKKTLRFNTKLETEILLYEIVYLYTSLRTIKSCIHHFFIHTKTNQEKSLAQKYVKFNFFDSPSSPCPSPQFHSSLNQEKLVSENVEVSIF